MNRRRSLLISELPKGFKRKLSVKTNGENYVNSKMIPINTDVVFIDFTIFTKRTSLPRDTYGIFGSEKSYATGIGASWLPDGNGTPSVLDFYFGQNPVERISNMTNASVIGHRFKIQLSRNECAVDNHIYRNDTPNIELSIPIFLGGKNRNGVLNYASPIEIFSFQVINQGVMKQDLIPCIDPQNNACLFDLVSRKALYSAVDSEPLIVGQDV